MPLGTFHVRIVRARRLRKLSLISRMHTLAQVELCGVKKASGIVEGGHRDPEWPPNAPRLSLVLPSSDASAAYASLRRGSAPDAVGAQVPARAVITLRVLRHMSVSTDEVIGETQIDCAPFLADPALRVERWLDLYVPGRKSASLAGQVYVEVGFEPHATTSSVAVWFSGSSSSDNDSYQPQSAASSSASASAIQQPPSMMPDIAVPYAVQESLGSINSYSVPLRPVSMYSSSAADYAYSSTLPSVAAGFPFYAAPPPQHYYHPQNIWPPPLSQLPHQQPSQLLSQQPASAYGSCAPQPPPLPMPPQQNTNVYGSNAPPPQPQQLLQQTANGYEIYAPQQPPLPMPPQQNANGYGSCAPQHPPLPMIPQRNANGFGNCAPQPLPQPPRPPPLPPRPQSNIVPFDTLGVPSESNGNAASMPQRNFYGVPSCASNPPPTRLPQQMEYDFNGPFECVSPSIRREDRGDKR